MNARRVFVRLALLGGAGWMGAGVASAGPYTQTGYTVADMEAWATEVAELIRGPMDIADPELGDVSYGVEADVLGPASDDTLDVLSLGDGGSITVGFSTPIGDGEGVDLAVFENGFWSEYGLFAELAYVEVSTDGAQFARFESIALNDVPVPTFGELDPTDYYNLAGDQEAGLGTGFDLAELAGHPLVQSGAVDLSDIRYVRLVDVIGDGSTADADGRPIYDPYNTPFETGGFDLDAVGVRNVPEPGATLTLCVGILGLFALGRLRRAGAERSATARALAVALGVVAGLAGSADRASAVTVDFEDLGLGVESYYNGSDGAGGFTSGGVFFENNYNQAYESWDGFSASTTTDTTTPGYGNQYSAIAGSGAGGSATYAVGFWSSFAPEGPLLELPSELTLEGAYITNTTYAYLSMLNGDAWAKKFGGESGDDPDWFRLTIDAFDAGGTHTESLDFYLADFRFADGDSDYILDDWTYLDLSILGPLASLRFSLSSSDEGEFGMNTPAYFALDRLSYVPEPRVGLLVGLGLMVLGLGRSRSRRA